MLENRVVAFANMRQKMELDGRTPKRRVHIYTFIYTFIFTFI